MVFAMTGCGVSPESFEETGRGLEGEIPGLAAQLEVDFQVVDDLQEQDCSVVTRGDSPYDLSRYHLNLLASVESPEGATEVLDRAEEILTAEGWELGGRWDRRGRGDEIESSMYGREYESNFSVTFHLKHESIRGVEHVRLLLTSSCVEHRDTPREPLEFSVDLPAHEEEPNNGEDETRES